MSFIPLAILTVAVAAAQQSNPPADALGRLKRSAAPAPEALLRESRCTDKDGDQFADVRRPLAGWALTQLTR